MVVNKMSKLISFSEKNDKVREMMIAAANYSPDLDFSSLSEFLVAPALGSRKRRLDHLSQEEKIRRKKLKNREAAQTSRDRKKAYVQTLEEKLGLLEKENSLLSERVKLLEVENTMLRSREPLAGREAIVPGPAVPPTPLPQGRSLLPRATSSKLMSQCNRRQLSQSQKAWILVTAILFLMTSTGSATSHSRILNNLTRLPKLSSQNLEKLLNRLRERWKERWGRQQRAWNPLGRLK